MRTRQRQHLIPGALLTAPVWLMMVIGLAADVLAQPVVFARADAARARDERQAATGSVSAQASEVAVVDLGQPVPVGVTASRSSAAFGRLSADATGGLNTLQHSASARASSGGEASWGDVFTITSTLPAGTTVRFRARLELAAAQNVPWQNPGEIVASTTTAGTVSAFGRTTVSGLPERLGADYNVSFSVTGLPQQQEVRRSETITPTPVERELDLVVGRAYTVWHQLNAVSDVAFLTFGAVVANTYSSRFYLESSDGRASYTTASGVRYEPPPALPSLAAAVVSRPAVTLSWTAPTGGPAPAGYTVVASLAPGGPLVAQLPVGTQTSLSVAAPDGTFYVRVLARVNGVDVSSNEIRVDVAPPTVPGPPQSLSATVAGSVLTFMWQAPADSGGPSVMTYRLDAGSTPGASNLASGLTIGAGTTFTSPAVPNGAYYVRVRAENAAGISGPSNEVRVVVGPPPPSAPTLTGSVGAGGDVMLNWSVPSAGAVVTGYELHAGTAPGLSDLGVLSLIGGQTAFSTSGVPAGTYYARVAGRSGSGLGEFSNTVLLKVP